MSGRGLVHPGISIVWKNKVANQTYMETWIAEMWGPASDGTAFVFSNIFIYLTRTAQDK
jgi:hypothetical protein